MKRLKRLRIDKKGRVKLTAGNAVLRADFGKLAGVLTGIESARAIGRAAELGEKLRREDGK